MDYSQAISDAEKEHGLQPGILKRLVEVESSGNQKSLSKAGAIGLTQLLPSTAKVLGVNPHDPIQNIQGGAKYLRQNLDKFGGDYGQAIAGYNAGPNHKAVVAKNWDGLPNETKNYVNKFADFLVKPANADETPYQAPVSSLQPLPASEQIQWDDEQKPADNTIQWDDEQKPAQIEPAPALSFDEKLAKIKGDVGKENNIDNIKEKFNNTMGFVVPGSMWATPVKSGLTAAATAMNPEDNVGKQIYDGGKAALIAGGITKGINLAGKGINNFIKNNMVHTTDDVANTAVNNLLNKVAGVAEKTRPDIVAKANSNVDSAYSNLDNLTKSSQTPIKPTQIADALQKVNALDNTALQPLAKNEITHRAVGKALVGEDLTANEAATLHKHLVRISGVDGETKLALKGAQQAISADIVAAGNPELNSALNTASTNYARAKSLEKLGSVVAKHISETDTGQIINHKGLSNGLKNWSLSKDGLKALKFNPGLKEEITNYQMMVNEHPELKDLVPKNNDFPGASLEKQIVGAIRQNVLGGLGAAGGGLVGGLPGAAAGFVAEKVLAKGANTIGRAVLNTQYAKDKFANSLLAKVPQINPVSKTVMPNVQQVIDNAVVAKQQVQPTGSKITNADLFALGKKFENQNIPQTPAPAIDVSQASRTIPGQVQPERVFPPKPYTPNFFMGNRSGREVVPYQAHQPAPQPPIDVSQASRTIPGQVQPERVFPPKPYTPNFFMGNGSGREVVPYGQPVPEFAKELASQPVVVAPEKMDLAALRQKAIAKANQRNQPGPAPVAEEPQSLFSKKDQHIAEQQQKQMMANPWLHDPRFEFDKKTGKLTVKDFTLLSADQQSAIKAEIQNHNDGVYAYKGWDTLSGKNKANLQKAGESAEQDGIFRMTKIPQSDTPKKMTKKQLSQETRYEELMAQKPIARIEEKSHIQKQDERMKGLFANSAEPKVGTPGAQLTEKQGLFKARVQNADDRNIYDGITHKYKVGKSGEQKVAKKADELAQAKIDDEKYLTDWNKKFPDFKPLKELPHTKRNELLEKFDKQGYLELKDILGSKKVKEINPKFIKLFEKYKHNETLIHTVIDGRHKLTPRSVIYEENLIKKDK